MSTRFHPSNVLMCRMMAYDFEVFHVLKAKLPVYVFLGKNKHFFYVLDVFPLIFMLIATKKSFSPSQPIEILEAYPDK